MNGDEWWHGMAWVRPLPKKGRALQVAVDIGAGVGIMSALAVVHGKLGHVHAVEAPSQ